MAVGARFDEVLDAARSGAEWAWATLYRELSPAVLGYLRARGAADPNDLLGEVFLHVVRDLRTFQGGEGDFRAWVFTLAHHRLLDDSRRRGRRPAGPVADDAGRAPHPAGDVEREALDGLGTARVLELLGRLPIDQQSVLLLRIVGDLTVEQVGRALGKRTGAVKALQRRGLAALERELAKEGVPL